jgi:RecD/TraA family predicted helicase
LLTTDKPIEVQTNNAFRIEVIPEKELFYSDDFGVYACRTEENVPIIMNKWGNFVINGVMQRLNINQKYDMLLEEVTHKKYGKGYEVKKIFYQNTNTIEGQHSFLRAILTDYQAELLIENFPDQDIIEMLKNDTLDYDSVKGMGKVTYEKIKEKVLGNLEYMDALNELEEYGIDYKALKRILKQMNCSPGLLIQKVKENIYVLCEVDGIGFITVDKYALRSGIDPESPYRIESAIEYVLKKAEDDGHCWLRRSELIRETAKETKLKESVIENHVDKMSSNNKFFIDNDRIGLSSNRFYEEQIADKLIKLIENSGNFVVENLENKITEIQEKLGFELTDEQKNAIYEAIKNNVLIISGKAGTGKTSTLRGEIMALDQYSYNTCALSGKAAQRIVEGAGLISQTIHRLLAYNPESGFKYNENNRLQEDIIVLDECSMVNSYLFYKLISAIKDNGKLIILGDIEQLPPIGVGNILRDMIDSKVIPVIELTKVHRQAMKSGILLAANAVRDGKQINKKGDYKRKIVGELKDLRLVPFQERSEIKQYIIDYCENIKNNIDIMEFQVIVPMKNRGDICTKELNKELQKVFNPNENSLTVSSMGYEYRVGDKIIKNGNDYDNGVFNGTLGIIEEIEYIDKENKITGIRFIGNENLVWYTQKELKQIDMAYALTCHRFQGSQSEHVLVALDWSAYKLLTKQWVYTALTRASKFCTFVFENDALRYAISQDVAIERNTYLKELLIEKAKKNNRPE